MAECPPHADVLATVEVRMRRLTVAVTGLVLGALSCSSATKQPPSSVPSESMLFVSPTSVIHASFEGSRVFGPQLELARDENGLRGRGPLGVVDLRKGGDSIRGVVGGGPTELYLERDGDSGFSLRGLYSGVLGDLEVRPDRIQGQLGQCQYNLRRHVAEEGAAYNGRRICGRRWMEPATVTLSPAIAALEPLDRAALIAVLLGR
jgi:hypothetical protein